MITLAIYTYLGLPPLVMLGAFLYLLIKGKHYLPIASMLLLPTVASWSFCTYALFNSDSAWAVPFGIASLIVALFLYVVIGELAIGQRKWAWSVARVAGFVQLVLIQIGTVRLILAGPLPVAKLIGADVANVAALALALWLLSRKDVEQALIS